MEPVVNVIIAVSVCVIFALIVIGCVSHRKKEPLSQPRDLETGVTGTKDGGLVVLTVNDATTAVVAAAVVMVEEMAAVVEVAAAVEVKGSVYCWI
ncbi:uncharacterized protein LOC9330511 isoform X2 [Arabidopsis lyrata subsp. lyrata]|uniref:uncharacterized protein LOC9330511 isoform X2 n=1 Tax=Arabidopsis lyrata subsp. lyrata TaxID=81972 RepID=UPI000A29AEA6|nr:uncharacterized protein LOC9330511 isoform X2 [Arabidopsis lyrata subsp. lyrata]|eukprot:XP_020869814.1 uncharacterized protein LOC9330511 isoform X2 [Arabidopsis lyrata subsp. lyrata]